MEVLIKEEEGLEIKKMLKKQGVKLLAIILGYTVLAAILFLFTELDKTYLIGFVICMLFVMGTSAIKVIKAAGDLKMGIKICQETQVNYVEWYMATTYYMEPSFRIYYPQIRQFKIPKNKLKEGVKVELSYLPKSKQIIGFRILEQNFNEEVYQ